MVRETFTLTVTRPLLLVLPGSLLRILMILHPLFFTFLWLVSWGSLRLVLCEVPGFGGSGLECLVTS